MSQRRIRYAAILVALAVTGEAHGGAKKRAVDRPPSATAESAARNVSIPPIVPRAAGSPSLVRMEATVYARARGLLARGRAKQALAVLESMEGDPLADRAALLRGDAFLALGDDMKAKAAYVAAMERSQVGSVSRAAARGLVAALEHLGEFEAELALIDALRAMGPVDRIADLDWQRTLALSRIGRTREAVEAAWRLALDHPTAPAAKKAEDFLAREKKRGIATPASNDRVELARLRNLIRTGAWNAAEKAILEMEKRESSSKLAIEMQRAEMYRRRKMVRREEEVLLRIQSQDLGDGDAPEVMHRLGQLAMSRDDDATAVARFDLLVRRFPNSERAVSGEYMAAWIAYNQNDFATATARMLAFAAHHPRAEERADALWFAGWSAYLAREDGAARRAFEQLLEEHPTSELGAHVHYWLGRMHHRRGDLLAARGAFRKVLQIEPFGYDGFWAMTRLGELGEVVVLDPPPATPSRATTDDVLLLLGSERPIGVDRGIALHAAGVADEALEELAAVAAHFRKGRDTRARVMIADMLETLDAHDLAFRVASGIADDGAELVTGEPWAWRAWRHAYPDAFRGFVDAASKAHGVDPFVIFAVMRTESNFRPHAASPVGALGLMQLMPATASAIGRQAPGGKAHAARFRAPESNIWLGGWYLDRLIDRFSGQLPLAIGAYNAGPLAMDAWVREYANSDLDEFIERIPYRETRRYVRRVLETFMIYRRLNGEPLPTLAAKVVAKTEARASVDF